MHVAHELQNHPCGIRTYRPCMSVVHELHIFTRVAQCQHPTEL